MTACACDKSPTSPRTTARSAFPDEKAFAASSALDVSTTLSRTGALMETSRAAIADMIRAASPSNEPTAIVNVVGREYQRYAKAAEPASRMTTPATRTTRSHLGIPIESILALIRGAFAVPSLDYTTFFADSPSRPLRWARAGTLLELSRGER